MVLNPSFSAFAIDCFIRRITKLEGDKVRMEFLDLASNNVEMTMEKHQHTIQEYESVAADDGMRLESWKQLFATPDAVEKMGQSFWKPCHEHQPYVVHRAEMIGVAWIPVRAGGGTPFTAAVGLTRTNVEDPHS